MKKFDRVTSILIYLQTKSVVAANMGLANVVKLTIYVTDMDEAMKNFDLLGMCFGPLGIAPPMTLVGVTRLALPSLMIEIEATAAD